MRLSLQRCCRVLGTALLAAPLAVGAATAKETGFAGPELGDFGGLSQVMGALFLVLIAVFAVAWIAKRVLRIPTQAHGPIRVVGGLPLGPRERLLLVEVGDKQLLLGLVPGRIEALHILDEPISAEAFSGGGFAEHMAAQGRERFGALARVVRSRSGRSPTSDDEGGAR